MLSLSYSAVVTFVPSGGGSNFIGSGRALLKTISIKPPKRHPSFYEGHILLPRSQGDIECLRDVKSSPGPAAPPLQQKDPKGFRCSALQS